MVRVTDQAANAMQELLADNAAPPEAGIRLSPSTGGNLGMGIDTPHDGDEVITRDEAPLLIVDADVAPGMTDMVVDFRDTSENGQTPGGFLLRPINGDE